MPYCLAACLLAAMMLTACAQKNGQQEQLYSATGQVYDNNTMMNYYYIK